MQMRLTIPKWAIVGLLVAAGCLIGWLMRSPTSGLESGHPSSTMFSGENSDGYGDGSFDTGWRSYDHETVTLPPATAPVTSPEPTPTLQAPAGNSGPGDSLDLVAVPAADGTWHLVGNGATSSTPLASAGNVSPTRSAQRGSDATRGSPSNTTRSSDRTPVTGTTPPRTAAPNYADSPRSIGASPSSALAIPPTFGESLMAPLPGASSRAVAFSEWESYRTDVNGRNILVTTDDSNFFEDRDGKLNANTGDTDASGLNVTDASDSVIRGTESADEAPWQTLAAMLVDLASDRPGGGLDSDPDDDADDESDESAELAADGNATALGLGSDPPPPFSRSSSGMVTPSVDAAEMTAPDPEEAGESDEDSDSDEAGEASGDPPSLDGDGTAAPPDGSQPSQPTQGSQPTGPATAGVVPADSPEDGDFAYREWIKAASRDVAMAVHTDEGSTLASGADAFVVGGDGYDDDDNRATGENIRITRDDGNVVIGGSGNVNAQIGDSEQGAVIMGVQRVLIEGGGAY